MKSRNSRPRPVATGCSVCGQRKSSAFRARRANAYAKEVVAADFEEAGDNDVLHKVLKDLTAKGNAVTEAELRAKMDELMAQAIAQVKAG